MGREGSISVTAAKLSWVLFRNSVKGTRDQAPANSPHEEYCILVD